MDLTLEAIKTEVEKRILEAIDANVGPPDVEAISKAVARYFEIDVPPLISNCEINDRGVLLATVTIPWHPAYMPMIQDLADAGLVELPSIDWIDVEVGFVDDAEIENAVVAIAGRNVPSCVACHGQGSVAGVTCKVCEGEG